MITPSESVSLAPELAEAARRFAENRHCSLDELADEALRSYIGIDVEQMPSVQEHLQRAMQLGLTPDEYAVRMVKETRRERRAERDQTSAL